MKKMIFSHRNSLSMSLSTFNAIFCYIHSIRKLIKYLNDKRHNTQYNVLRLIK